MRKLMLALVFVLLALPVSAQPNDGGAPNFKVVTHIDWPQEGAVVSRTELHVAGWVHECGSGLQPVTQRIGSVSLRFYNAITGNHIPSFTLHGSLNRPDVAAAYTPSCPAIGPYVGYALTLPPGQAPPPGFWRVDVSWATTDGAGRIRIAPPVSRNIFIIE
jgi:hypothetical protein